MRSADVNHRKDLELFSNGFNGHAVTAGGIAYDGVDFLILYQAP